MDPLTIAGMVTGGANVGLGIWNAITGQQTAEDNLNLQKEQFEYQKSLQQTMFSREDNAVQRRAADLEAAGLSKTLAAGGAAQAGPVVSTQAPQKGKEGLEGIGNLSNSLTAALAQIATTTDISKTRADAALSAAQAEKIKAETVAQTENNLWIKDFNSQKYLLGDAQIANTEKDTVNKYLDSLVKQFNISLQDIEKEKALLSAQAARLGVDSQSLDIAAKQIAIDKARYNYQWYNERGLPMDAAISEKWQALDRADQVIKDLTGRSKK